MRATLSSFALVGIDAVPLDMIVEGDQVKVVPTRNRRVLHSVRLRAPGAGTPLSGLSVQGTPNNLAPARIIAGLPCPLPPSFSRMASTSQ
jgi:hypothetical protein